jgi:hypothetical protein
MRKYYFSLRSNLLLLAFASLLFTFNQLNAQVGIGTTSPQAMLDIVASNPNDPLPTDGFLMPRVQQLSFDSNPPAVGTMVFYSGDTGVGNGNMKNTVYSWNGTNWVSMAGEIASPDDPKLLYEYDEVNKGVVFWIDQNDPYHYKIVSPVELTNVKYGDNSGPASCTGHACTSSDLDGFDRTKAWNTAHSGINSADYGTYVNSATYYFNGIDGSGTTPIGWYTPTEDELYLIIENSSGINGRFETESLAHTDISPSSYYWACSDYLPNTERAIQILAINRITWWKTSGASDDRSRIVREIGR